MKEVVIAGDALSQLIQVTARQVGATAVQVTGKGQADLKFLITRYRDALIRNREWATAVKDIIDLIDSTDCPESVKAYVTAAVLRARVNGDLLTAPKPTAIEVKVS